MRRSGGVIAAVAVVLAAGAAGAEPKAPAAVGIALTAAPIFGSDAATGNGWNEVVARIDNTGGAAQKGTVELAMAGGFGSSDLEVAARAPFAVPAGRAAVVTLPMRDFSAYYAPQVVVTAKDENGNGLESVSVTVNSSQSPLLVEIAQPARLGALLRGWPVPLGGSMARGPGGAATQLTTGAPGVDRATGDPVLPDRAAGYGEATLVLVTSERLATIDPARQAALFDWVHGGGSLAIVPTRPEDLRAPWMESLVGGAVARGPAPTRLVLLPAFKKPQSDEADDAADAPPDTQDPQAPKPPGALVQRPLRAGPSDAVRARLSGWGGGRLAPSDVGATAPCGLGEVHLLAFDPTAAPGLDDAWAQTRVVDLVARAWERRTRVALPVGGGERGTARLEDVRRALDPNESFRLGLAISALLLVAYAFVVGPLIFARATKKGSPLLPLKWVPVTSAAAFFAIVLVGFGIKGWRGSSRHLTLLEAGSGDGRASMRSYRGFYASETRSLAIAATTPTSVLTVASMNGRAEAGALRLERDGATLTDLASLPWQTVVVREDGLTDLGGGVVLRATGGGNVVVENHTGRVLKDVLVHAPKSSNATYFTTIEDGEVVDTPRGRPVAGVGATSSSSGTTHLHELGAEQVGYLMPGREGKRIGETWGPIEQAAGNSVDWWPDDAPALVGEMVGRPRAARDAGLVLESDRVLLHVVGEGAR